MDGPDRLHHSDLVEAGAAPAHLATRLDQAGDAALPRLAPASMLAGRIDDPGT
jgi:hypothetical protein